MSDIPRRLPEDYVRKAKDPGRASARSNVISVACKYLLNRTLHFKPFAGVTIQIVVSVDSMPRRELASRVNLGSIMIKLESSSAWAGVVRAIDWRSKKLGPIRNLLIWL